MCDELGAFFQDEEFVHLCFECTKLTLLWLDGFLTWAVIMQFLENLSNQRG